mgnify:CR=1 FL=1
MKSRFQKVLKKADTLGKNIFWTHYSDFEWHVHTIDIVELTIDKVVPILGASEQSTRRIVNEFWFFEGDTIKQDIIAGDILSFLGREYGECTEQKVPIWKQLATCIGCGKRCCVH